MRTNRSVVSGRTNGGFIPATGLAPRGLAGCNTPVPWQASAPLFQSPRGGPFGPSALSRLLCPLQTSFSRSEQIPPPSASFFRTRNPRAREKPPGVRLRTLGAKRRIYKTRPSGKMEDFVVTCPLVPSVSHLESGSCTSPRTFGLGFLQTLPHGNALALLLAFGSSYTWLGDLHPVSSVPCPAHTWRSAARFSASAAAAGYAAV